MNASSVTFIALTLIICENILTIVALKSYSFLYSFTTSETIFFIPGVAVNSMCPGSVSTEIFKKAESFIGKYIYYYLVPVLGKVGVLFDILHIQLFYLVFFLVFITEFSSQKNMLKKA